MKMRPMLLAGAALVAASLPLSAQESVDARWLPFVGCWEALGAEEEIGLLCFDTDATGVVLTNYSDGEVVSSERLVADGQQRDVVVEGCEGWEAVDFSADGRRAFTQTEFVCGDADARTGTGVMTFTTVNQWADVRALVVAGEEVAWVQEYQLASQERIAEEGITNPAADRAMAVRTARMAAAASIDLDDVEEAAGRMDAKAVETWIVAKQDRFDPSADDLERLADAGASDAVIDAVVAVSYPDRFIVDASGPIEQVADAPRPTHYRGYMAYNPFGPRLAFGVGYAPWGFGYSPYYGYGYGYGYAGSPWGYPGYGYGYGYGGYRPGYVVIDRRPSGGRVYSDRGYTQGGRTSSGSAGRVARPRSGPPPTYSLGGGTRDPGTATSGGSSSTGRTAAPRRARRRPPGGN